MALIGYSPLSVPSPFRVQREDGTVVTAEVLGRCVKIVEHVRGHIPVLDFHIRFEGRESEVREWQGRWYWGDEVVTLLDAGPWLDDE